MKDRQFHIYLDDEEYGQVLQALIDLKNNLIAQGRYTDAVDDVLIKFTKARKKKMTMPLVSLRRSRRLFCVFRAIFKVKKIFFKFFSEKGRFWVCILTPFVQMSEGVISPQGISPFTVP